MAYCAENVCVELDNENTHLYAIGSRSHISFVDDRLSDKVTSVRSLDKDCGKYFHTIDLNFLYMQWNFAYSKPCSQARANLKCFSKL